MKEASKINVDTVKAREEDEAWARRFLYPDLRKPYMLFYNPQGYKHAADLVAKARRAILEEQATTKTGYSYTKNGQDQPIGERERKILDEGFKEMDSLFKRIEKMFKRLGG